MSHDPALYVLELRAGASKLDYRALVGLIGDVYLCLLDIYFLRQFLDLSVVLIQFKPLSFFQVLYILLLLDHYVFVFIKILLHVKNIFLKFVCFLFDLHSEELPELQELNMDGLYGGLLLLDVFDVFFHI